MNPKNSDRDINIDALRGFALIAVTLVNLTTEFRVPFMLYLRDFHTDAGVLNHATDWYIAMLLEGKGFVILSILFGAGLAAMAERHPTGVHMLLLRRNSFLLLLGCLHILFFFSGDILTLYSLTGLLIIPLLGLNSFVLTFLIVLGMCARFLIPWPFLPLSVSITSLIDAAYKAYGAGSFIEIFYFRIFELKNLIAPLLLSVWPRTFALMLLGVLSWRYEWLSYIRNSEQNPRMTKIILFMLLFGAIFTFLEAFIAMRGWSLGRWATVIGDMGAIGLAFGYSILVLRTRSSNIFVRSIAKLGRMSLTTYIFQNIFLGCIFYGYGLALYGKLGSFEVACFGFGLYFLQIMLACFYLSKYDQGPFERVWRTVTYFK